METIITVENLLITLCAIVIYVAWHIGFILNQLNIQQTERNNALILTVVDAQNEIVRVLGEQGDLLRD